MMKLGLVKNLVKNELKKIQIDKYDQFYMNTSTIEVYDGENSFIELRLLSKNELEKTRSINTFSSDIFVCCVGGCIDMLEYSISSDGSILSCKENEMDSSFHFFGKTSKTNKTYEFIPTTDKAMILVGIDKSDMDDFYINYDKESLNIEDVISTDLSESRLEFWMTFFDDLNIILKNEELLGNLIKQAKTRKLKDYLTSSL
ncbi:hypothetical protein AB6C83_08740 [Vibrio cyclitrophicus]